MLSGQPAGTPALPKPSAADEVDDLQLIAIGQLGCGPLLPRDDVAIPFHGHAILLHAELFDQHRQGDRSEALFLPVDDDFHCNDFRNYRTKEQAQATWPA